jgi:gliding-associated putative ABC transporter substrate-binding component GldG
MENKELKKSTRKNLKKEFFIYLGILILIVITVNFISNRLFTRIDLTKHKTYTLSDISKDIVKNLNDKVIVRAYFSDNLPAPYNNVSRDVKDLLSDYRSYSKGNLDYEFVSTSNEESEANENETVKEAQKFGIQPVQLQVFENDKYEVKRVLMGMVINYIGKSETIPFVQSASNLEYELTSRIKKLSTEKKKKIGFLTGHGEYEYTKFNTINSTLTSNYDVVQVNLGSNNPVPDDVDALIVFGPKSEFPEWHKYLIDQYIMRGGNVAWLINKMIPNFQQEIALATVQDLKIDDMLFHYGIKINGDMIKDVQCSPVTVQTQIGFPLQISYPYFPLVSNINREISAFQNIQSVTMPFVSSLDLTAADGKGLEVKPLLTSSDKSGKSENFVVINFEQFQNLSKKMADSIFNSKGFVLGATYTGMFSSFYSGKPVPQDTAANSQPVNIEQKNQSEKPSKMVVIGDADFANEENRPQRDNLIFFINMVDYLADDVGLTEIRSKDASEAPIQETSPSTKSFIKYFNLLFPPVAVIFVGLYIWSRKKSVRKKLQSDNN